MGYRRSHVVGSTEPEDEMFTPRLDVLPPAQRKLWPSLVQIPNHYVLYGGTAIALRLGHRESNDFDFFSEVALDDARKQKLLSDIQWLGGASILQNEKNTLTVSILQDENPIKLSFFGEIKNGCVSAPDRTDDHVLCVASLEDLFAHKLKVIHDRAEGKDYQDIAAMLANGQRLESGLAAREALFGSSVPTMTTLKALAYFDDISEASRLTDAMKTSITSAINRLPNEWDAVNIVSHTLNCAGRDLRSN
jgi:predicted nucleotidyltransferase component of viral defense system